MKDALSKLSTVFLALVIALSALVVLPGSIEGQTMQPGEIRVPVEDVNVVPVNTAKVNLTNVHTGEVYTASLYSSGLYRALNVPSGYYKVDVTATNYYDVMNAKEFRYESLAGYVTQTVRLVPFPAKIYQYTVEVIDSDGEHITDAVAGFYNVTMRETVSSDAANDTGMCHVPMFKTNYPMNFILYVSAPQKETVYQWVNVTGSDSITVTLSASKRVGAYVRNWDGSELLENVVAYLLNTDPTIPMIKRLMKSDTGGSNFAFDAYAGTYLLCVDADNGDSRMETITIEPTDIGYSNDDFRLENQTQRLEEVALTFGADMNSFALASDTAWSYDEPYNGLPYSDVGSLRMQIDLNSAVPDADLDQTEIDNFVAKITSAGTEYVTSSRLLMFNATAYKSQAASVSIAPLAGLTLGPVSIQNAITYSYTANFVSVSNIQVGMSMYNGTAYAKYDTSMANYTYVVSLPNSYELVHNTSLHTAVAGYLTITLDPEEYIAGNREAVSLQIQESMKPEAGAAVEIIDTDYAYAVENATGVVIKYIVRVGESVNFTASDSLDPNGNPLIYTWNFGDATSVTTSNVTIAHTYTSAANRTVTLTLTDVAGPSMTNSTTITVICDARDPTPDMSVKSHLVVDDSIWVNESEIITVNATYSIDDAVTSGDEEGLIDYFQFFYGEGNVSSKVSWEDDQKNVSFSYADAGEYTLTLNVTDVIGHYKNTTLTVHVNDTTDPAVTFSVKNESWGSSIIEQQNTTFDANATTDNIDNNTLMYYVWHFGDGLGDSSWLNGTGLYNVTHKFTKVGSFTVTLNVTDLSNNSKATTKRVTVSSAPRPDVRVDSVSFDPEVFTDGDAGLIVVNMTNRGSVAATGVVVTFYIEDPDGSERLIGSTSDLLNGTSHVTVIEVGGQVQVKFSWTPSSKGSYSIKVNVTSTNQLNADDLTDVVTVNEAKWVQPALWIGVIVVLLLIPTLIYVRGRLAKREKKGPRREKKEKSEE